MGEQEMGEQEAGDSASTMRSSVTVSLTMPALTP